MKPGNQRIKGARFCLDCVNAARGYNIPTDHTGHAQAGTGTKGFFGDITMKVMGLYRKIECKIGQQTPRCLYKWILEGDQWAVFHRRDFEPTLVTMRYSDWLELVHAAGYGTNHNDMHLAVIRGEEVDAE